MKYRNPEIREGINVSAQHPLKEFVLLTLGALLLIVAATWLVAQFSGTLARMIPFEKEVGLVPESAFDQEAGPELQAYLDEMSRRVVAVMELPEGMQIKVHYSAGKTFNAFATLGGHVLLYRGLLEKLPHENALAMLLAHEIAHVVHRDPVVSLGRGIAIQSMIGLFLGNADLGVLGNAGIYTQLRYGREMESDADAAALLAVQRLYGHVAGAKALFEVFQNVRAAEGAGEVPALFSSHPLDAARLRAIDEAVVRQGWRGEGELTALPKAFTQWLEASARAADASEGALN